MPAGKDGLLRKDTRDAAAVLAGRITAYGVRRYGRPERSLRQEEAAGRNVVYGVRRSGRPERSLMIGIA